MEYVRQNGLRLRDLFGKFNKTGKLTLTYEEFYRGMQVSLFLSPKKVLPIPVSLVHAHVAL